MPDREIPQVQLTLCRAGGREILQICDENCVHTSEYLAFAVDKIEAKLRQKRVWEIRGQTSQGLPPVRISIPGNLKA